MINAFSSVEYNKCICIQRSQWSVYRAIATIQCVIHDTLYDTLYDTHHLIRSNASTFSESIALEIVVTIYWRCVIIMQTKYAMTIFKTRLEIKSMYN